MTAQHINEGDRFDAWRPVVDGPDGPVSMEIGDFGPVTIVSVNTVNDTAVVRYDAPIQNGFEATYPIETIRVWVGQRIET